MFSGKLRVFVQYFVNSSFHLQYKHRYLHLNALRSWDKSALTWIHQCSCKRWRFRLNKKTTTTKKKQWISVFFDLRSSFGRVYLPTKISNKYICKTTWANIPNPRSTWVTSMLRQLASYTQIKNTWVTEISKQTGLFSLLTNETLN